MLWDEAVECRKVLAKLITREFPQSNSNSPAYTVQPDSGEAVYLLNNLSPRGKEEVPKMWREGKALRI